jgi:hypothetical protein
MSKKCAFFQIHEIGISGRAGRSVDSMKREWDERGSRLSELTRPAIDPSLSAMV